MKNKFLYVFIYIILISIFTIIMETCLHENSHKTIAEEFGCENATIHYNFLDVSYTTSICNNFTEAKKNAYLIAQANVEANYERGITDFLLLLILYFLAMIFFMRE